MNKPLAAASLLFPAAVMAGCNAAFWGNLAVLGVTVGIFWGTLSLGRTTETRGAEASQTDRG